MMRFRHAVQLAALAIMLALPMLSRGGALHEAFGAGARNLDSLATPWERFLIIAFSTVFGWLDDPVGATALFQGGYWSITLFGITAAVIEEQTLLLPCYPHPVSSFSVD